MIPHTDQALRMLSQRLMVQLLPELGSTYSLSDGALVGLLMNAIADEMAEGIQRRLEDIAQMETILNGALDYLAPEDQDTLAAPLASYSLKDVNDRHDNLMRILIDLHARAETDEAMMAICNEIWGFLRQWTERHTITAVP